MCKEEEAGIGIAEAVPNAEGCDEEWRSQERVSVVEGKGDESLVGEGNEIWGAVEVFEKGKANFLSG